MLDEDGNLCCYRIGKNKTIHYTPNCRGKNISKSNTTKRAVEDTVPVIVKVRKESDSFCKFCEDSDVERPPCAVRVGKRTEKSATDVQQQLEESSSSSSDAMQPIRKRPATMVEMPDAPPTEKWMTAQIEQDAPTVVPPTEVVVVGAVVSPVDVFVPPSTVPNKIKEAAAKTLLKTGALGALPAAAKPKTTKVRRTKPNLWPEATAAQQPEPTAAMHGWPAPTPSVANVNAVSTHLSDKSFTCVMQYDSSRKKLVWHVSFEDDICKLYADSYSEMVAKLYKYFHVEFEVKLLGMKP